MANKKVAKILHCKKVSIKDCTTPLQDLLRAALERKSTAGDRSEPLSDGRTTAHRVIAQVYPFGPSIAGVMTTYEQGASAVTVTVDPGIQQIPLTQLQPPNADDGARREWVEGLLYFYVRGNFVVLIQSAAVRSRQFEEHLSWLLREDGKPVGPAVLLADQITKDAQQRIKTNHVKSVTIGGELLHKIEAPAAPGTEAVSRKVEVKGPFLSALKALIGESSSAMKWLDGLDGNITAELVVKYNRKTDPNAQQLLDNIALALRNTDDLDTEIELARGGSINGSDLRVTTRENIPATDGVLNLDEAFSAMHRWMNQLATDQDLFG